MSSAVLVQTKGRAWPVRRLTESRRVGLYFTIWLSVDPKEVLMFDPAETLYHRLGDYDAIAAAVDDPCLAW